MVVTCGQQNADMKRADLRLAASATAPVYMNWGNYPVLALRTDLPGGGKGVGKGGVYTLNLAPVTGSGANKAENNGLLLSVRHYFTKTFNIIIRMHYTRMYETGRIVDFYLFIFPFIHSIYSIFNLAACTQCDSCEQSYC